jgi:hypothetical protein
MEELTTGGETTTSHVHGGTEYSHGRNMQIEGGKCDETLPKRRSQTERSDFEWKLMGLEKKYILPLDLYFYPKI